jgi:hypothetical protein
MNYSKPEVNTLGQATMVIEAHTSKNVMSTIDPNLTQFNPAYDLDE